MIFFNKYAEAGFESYLRINRAYHVHKLGVRNMAICRLNGGNEEQFFDLNENICKRFSPKINRENWWKWRNFYLRTCFTVNNGVVNVIILTITLMLPKNDFPSSISSNIWTAANVPKQTARHDRSGRVNWFGSERQNNIKQYKVSIIDPTAFTLIIGPS